MVRPAHKNQSILPKIPKKGRLCQPIIVQCPACQTKFSVPSSLLLEVDIPRFHCSRCDFIFTNEKERLLEAKAATPKINCEEEEAEFEPLPGLSNYPLESEVEAVNPPKTQPSKKWPAPDLSVKAKKISPPHENLPLREEESGSTPDPNQIAFKFPPAPHRRKIKADSSAISPAPKKNGFKLPPQNSTPKDLLEGSYREAPSEIQPLDKLSAPRRTEQFFRQLSRWHGTLILLLPILGLLILLILFSFALQNFSSSTSDPTSWITPGLPSVAPAELILDDLNYRLVNLDNGESVPIISGKIINSSQESFSEITVEGLAFDHLGRNIGRTRANAASTLARTRVKSLSLKMIRELQTDKPDKPFLLSPGSEHDFSLALFFGENQPTYFIEDPLSRIKYFSARIYSVKYQ